MMAQALEGRQAFNPGVRNDGCYSKTSTQKTTTIQDPTQEEKANRPKENGEEACENLPQKAPY